MHGIYVPSNHFFPIAGLPHRETTEPAKGGLEGTHNLGFKGQESACISGHIYTGQIAPIHG